MGARKRSKKINEPNRHVIMVNRREKNDFKEFSNYNGSHTYLNFVRRFLMNDPYKNGEYQKEFLRYTNQMYTKLAEKMGAKIS